MEFITLNNGVKMPAEGIGTFLLTPDKAETAVLSALKDGARLIDTANAYCNEKAVGRAMKKSGLLREEIFLETKLWPTFYTDADAVDKTLARLDTDYIDLLLIHQPAGDYVAGYRLMEKAYKEGKVRAIGLSNFNEEQIFVRSKKIVPCNACYYCRDHGGKCALNDDMSEILDAMQAADVIVMASPVYFYSIDAQMKIIIDRSLARWTNIPNKEFYFIMTCADDNRAAMACTLECFRGFTACLNGAKEKGVIYGTGVYRPGEVMSSPAMKEAYEMGKNV